jgi:hypothetical protein
MLMLQRGVSSGTIIECLEAALLAMALQVVDEQVSGNLKGVERTKVKNHRKLGAST